MAKDNVMILITRQQHCSAYWGNFCSWGTMFSAFWQNPFNYLCRDSDVVPMSDSHNNMIAYGFNDVTFGGDLDLPEAMISLRPLKFTRYGCPNSERPVGAIFYLMKIMYVYGVGYILNCAIHILHWAHVFNSSLKRYLLVIVHCGEFTKGNLFCLLYFLNKKLSRCILYVMYHMLVYPTSNQYAINNTIFSILCELLWKLFLPPVATYRHISSWI